MIGNHASLLRIQKEGQCLLIANPDVWKQRKQPKSVPADPPGGGDGLDGVLSAALKQIKHYATSGYCPSENLPPSARVCD